MERLLGFLPIVMIVFFLISLAGYYQGMEVWLGWGFWRAFGVMILAAFLGGFGGLFISIVGFVGIWKGWGWQWWQAAIVVFPGLALMIMTIIGGGVMAMFQRITGRAN